MIHPPTPICVAGNSLSRQVPAIQKFGQTLQGTVLIFTEVLKIRQKSATAPIYCELVRFILQQTLRLCTHGNPFDVRLVVKVLLFVETFCTLEE